MLLALRRIIEGKRSIPIRIGVNQGSVFSGDIGPPYRRTYTVMGDPVNLAARVMSKASPGQLLATEPVLDASTVEFHTTPLEPFMVKGKKEPVVAHAVEQIVGTRHAAEVIALPLVGRDLELAAFDEALASARQGHGRTIEIVGPPGIGKTRLLRELFDRATGFDVIASACELYQASTAYRPFQKILQTVLEIPEEASDVEAADLLRAPGRNRSPRAAAVVAAPGDPAGRGRSVDARGR